MRAGRKVKFVLRVIGIIFLIYAGLIMLVYFRQRAMLFFPSYTAASTGLAPWMDGGRIIGYCREATRPQTIWLMMHGNGGQAADRDYVLRRMSDQDSLYVLEYPGYGSREGSPSMQSFNQAASDAYQLLRARNPGVAVCALGESIGSGPACALAGQKVPPDKIVLVVPFDTLAKVAQGHYPFLPVRLMLRDAWDNVESLKHYIGPVDIFAAEEDSIIPFAHAQTLAKATPTARFIPIKGGHNDWSESDLVRVRR